MIVRNGRCLKTIFDKIILCAGTMTDFGIVYEKAIQGTSANQSQASIKLTFNCDCMGRLEAVKPTSRIDGIAINSQTTHLYYMPFDNDVFNLNIDTLYIEVEKSVSRNRFFKVQAILNLDEQDEYIVFTMAERGFAELEAARS